jgi:hypothetical protein
MLANAACLSPAQCAHIGGASAFGSAIGFRASEIDAAIRRQAFAVTQRFDTSSIARITCLSGLARKI